MNTPTVAQILAQVGFINETGNGSSLPIVELNGKKHTVKTKTVIKSGFFSDLQNGEALKASDLEKAGVRSYTGNKLEAGKTHQYSAVRLLIDTTAVAGDIASAATKDAFLASASFANSAPGFVKNSTFSVVQGTPLCSVTGSEIKNDKLATSNQDDFKQLSGFTIRPLVPMNYAFLMPEGATISNLVAYRLEFQVLEFVEATHA